MGNRVLGVLVAAVFVIGGSSRYDVAVHAQGGERPQVSVRPADDFEVNGAGDNAAWQRAAWTPLHKRQPDGHPYQARFKALYSKTGLYFLMEGTDRKLTATMDQDFLDLWNEDVFEVFLWTDERYPVYLEYEISPLNHELPILVPNFGGQFLGWRPWHFEQDRLTRKATTVIGRHEGAACRYPGLARRILHPVRAAQAAAERAADGRDAVARQLLSRRLRRRQDHAVGLGPGRRRAFTSSRNSATCCSSAPDANSRLDWGIALGHVYALRVLRRRRCAAEIWSCERPDGVTFLPRVLHGRHHGNPTASRRRRRVRARCRVVDPRGRGCADRRGILDRPRHGRQRRGGPGRDGHGDRSGDERCLYGQSRTTPATIRSRRCRSGPMSSTPSSPGSRRPRRGRCRSRPSRSRGWISSWSSVHSPKRSKSRPSRRCCRPKRRRSAR